MDYKTAWEILMNKVSDGKRGAYQSLNWERGGAMADAFQYVLEMMNTLEGEINE